MGDTIEGKPVRSAAETARFALWLMVALGVGIALALVPYIPGLLGAPILYVITAPVHRRLRRTIGARVAAVVTIIAVLLLILLPLGWLLSVAVSELPQIVRNLSSAETLSRIPTLHIGPFDLRGQLAGLGGELVSWSSHQAFNVVGGATRATLNLVLALTGLYFLLLSPGEIWSQTRGLLPFSPGTVERLRQRFHSVTESMMLGTALTAVLQGTIVGLGFWIVGLGNALFWGGVTALASMVPVVGSALVWLPAAGVLALEGRYGAAAALAAIGGIIASNIDNVLRPVIYRRVSNIHPMITLVGAFAGVGVFGFVGVLLGPLAISYFLELVHAYDQEYGAHPTTEAPPGA